jgi:hypothetical protein
MLREVGKSLWDRAGHPVLTMSRSESLTNRLARWATGLLIAMLLAGCAGASIAPQANSAPVSLNRPTTIYVYDFAVTAQDVTLNQGIFQKTYRDMTDDNQEQTQLQTAQETAKLLSAAIVQELQSLGFTATVMPRGMRVTGDNVLLVDGQFVEINEGNRLRRMVIGLGVGSSTLDTKVQVYQMAGGMTQQVMDFTTHADSGKMPGAAFTAPGGAVAGGAIAAASLGANLAAGAGKAYTSGMGYLAKKTADQSVAYMSQYFAAHYWIPESMVKSADVSSSGD